MHTLSSHPLSSQELPHLGVLWGITSKISELLNSEAFLSQSQELEKLFMQLNDTLDAKVRNALYDYKDYKQRLFRQEKDLEAILLQDQELKVLYENILRAIEFAPYLKYALWDKLLFDRVLELWPPPQEFSEPDTISFDELKITTSIPPYIMIKDLPIQVSPKELREVFSVFENTSWQELDLSSNNLWAFWQKQLQAIFSHLWGVRSLRLWNNGKLDEPRLHAIFSHLGNVRSIDLRGSALWKLEGSKLQVIFSHLGNVRSIDLSGSDLWKLDESRLHAIFSHLGNVRSIDLHWNSLWKLDEPCLQAIFSHLWNVKRISLWNNNLWKLDKPSLHAIFSHLTQIEEVFLESHEEVSRLESIFPILIGKNKIF